MKVGEARALREDVVSLKKQVEALNLALGVAISMFSNEQLLQWAEKYEIAKKQKLASG